MWCMVMMSPPFRGNNLLGNDPPVSERDFIVLPWEPVAAGTSARGEELPLWVTSLEAPWQGPIKSFARIPSRLLRGEGMFEATNPRVESWMMLVSGEGVLTIAGDTHYLKAPTWIYAPKAGWSLQSTEGEIVAFEFQVPAFDLGLFWQGLYDRFQHHFPGWLKYLLEDFVTA